MCCDIKQMKASSWGENLTTGFLIMLVSWLVSHRDLTRWKVIERICTWQFDFILISISSPIWYANFEHIKYTVPAVLLTQTIGNLGFFSCLIYYLTCKEQKPMSPHKLAIPLCTVYVSSSAKSKPLTCKPQHFSFPLTNQSMNVFNSFCEAQAERIVSVKAFNLSY